MAQTTRSDKSFAVQGGIFTLRGRAAWARDYNNDRAVTAVFQALPGASFVVNGARAGFSLAATFEGEHQLCGQGLPNIAGDSIA